MKTTGQVSPQLRPTDADIRANPQLSWADWARRLDDDRGQINRRCKERGWRRDGAGNLTHGACAECRRRMVPVADLDESFRCWICQQTPLRLPTSEDAAVAVCRSEYARVRRKRAAEWDAVHAEVQRRIAALEMTPTRVLREVVAMRRYEAA